MITFGDIMTRGLIYYDEEYKDECKSFCEVRKISYLPHIDKHHLIYPYDQKKRTFSKPTSIQDYQTVQEEDFVFNSGLKGAFAKHKILFVKQKKRLVGVVHFSDYNRPKVSDYLFQRLSRLEKGLVKLILSFDALEKNTLRPYKEQDVNPADHSLLEESDFRGSKMTLMKTLRYAYDLKILKIKEKHIDLITAIRNKIAHSEGLIDRAKGSSFDYKLGSYIRLLEGAVALEIAIKQVSNALYFTEIIHKKDPSIPVKPLEEVLFD